MNRVHLARHAFGLFFAVPLVVTMFLRQNYPQQLANADSTIITAWNYIGDGSFLGIRQKRRGGACGHRVEASLSKYSFSFYN